MRSSERELGGRQGTSPPSLTFVEGVGLGPHAEVVRRLRRGAWDPRNVAELEADDGHDDHAFHVLAYDDDRLLGAGRVCVHRDPSSAPDPTYFAGISSSQLPAPFAVLTRLVVAQEARGNGLARELLARRLAWATRTGARVAVVGVVAARIPMLDASGFVVIGPARHAVVTEWKRPEEPRYVMVRSLP